MRKFYSSIFALAVGVAASAQFTGFTGPTNQGGVGVLPATGGIGTIFTLTQPNNHFGQAKGVWVDATQNLSQAFSVCAKLNFGSFNDVNLDPMSDKVALNIPFKEQDRTGADGIAFVLSKASTTGRYVGETGEEMGYGTAFYVDANMPNGYQAADVFVAEFDTWQNEGTNTGSRSLNDPVADHMAFTRRGSAYHGLDPLTGVNNFTPATPLPELENGAFWDATFSWDPITGLTVNFNNGTIMNATAADVLAAIGSPGNNNVNVYWGFNSGTGLAANQHQVQIVTCPTPPADCTPGRTQTMGGWGQGAAGNNNGAYRDAHFASAFPAGVTIGLPGRSAKWTTSLAVENYLPAGGPSGVLPAGNLVNPSTNQLKNNAAGQVLTLSLSVGFDDADPNFSSSATALRDYVIASGPYAGITVGAFLVIANNVLGTAASTATQVSNVQGTAASINENFVDGTTDNGYLNCPDPVRPGGAEIRTEPNQPSSDVSTLSSDVYPNPSRGNVRFNLSQVEPGAQIYIINARGSIVERRVAGNAQNFDFNLKKYGVGVYMIKVVSGNDIKATKVIIQD
jgi:hypothetical protein